MNLLYKIIEGILNFFNKPPVLSTSELNALKLKEAFKNIDQIRNWYNPSTNNVCKEYIDLRLENEPIADFVKDIKSEGSFYNTIKDTGKVLKDLPNVCSGNIFFKDYQVFNSNPHVTYEGLMRYLGDMMERNYVQIPITKNDVQVIKNKVNDLQNQLNSLIDSEGLSDEYPNTNSIFK
jgi:hypothetical protein